MNAPEKLERKALLCRWCGSLGVRGSNRAEYCSDKCAYLAQSARRTAKRRAMSAAGQKRKSSPRKPRGKLSNVPLSIIDERAVPEPNTGCLLWTGPFVSNDYGLISFNGASYAAHRVAFAHAFGDPGSLHVCHRCDTPSCVNPDHLFAGTHADNMADKASKGRAPGFPGETTHLSKLSRDDVLEIRRLCAVGVRQSEIALLFNVSLSNVENIRSGNTWRHIGGPTTRDDLKVERVK